jgi:protein-S-isoprenylcysteine O-methyltransferase Ste14
VREHDSSRLPDPGVPFPPPFLFVAGFVAGLALERWVRRIHPIGDDLAALAALAGGLGVLLGLTIVGWGLLVFVRARTGIMPVRPARRLVVSGPYRFSRNPMYVGLGALYLGLALVFDVAWPILLFPLVVVALSRLVIRREERYLADAFGEDYSAYTRRVGRWL